MKGDKQNQTSYIWNTKTSLEVHLRTRESIIIIKLQKQVKEKTLNYCPD